MANTNFTGSIIKKCDCKHPFQDDLYGHQLRVMNNTKSGQPVCTVCSKKHK